MTYYSALLPLAAQVHEDNAKWWTDLDTGLSLLRSRNRLALLMLVVTEVSEFVDGNYTGARDQHLPEWPNWQIELADIAIRLLDMIGAEDKLHGQPLSGALKTESVGVVPLIQTLSLAAEANRKERVAVYRKALNTALAMVCDMARDKECNLLAAVEAKRAFNRIRADHSLEARRVAGGKKQ